MKPVQGMKVALLAAAVGWAGSVLAQNQPLTTGIYACTDAQGRRITADRPITECVDRDQRVLSHTGVEMRRVGPTLTEKEREAQDAQQRIKLMELSKAREQRSRERALQARYPNKAAHDTVRAEAVEQQTTQIAGANKRIEELQTARKKLDQEMEFYKKNPDKAPASLKRQVHGNDEDMADQLKFIKQREEEKRRINQQFDAEYGQLQKLWQSQPGK